MEKNTTLTFDKIAIYTVFYIILFFSLYAAMPYILPFVLGAIVALICEPLINLLVQKFKFNRKATSIIAVLIVFGIFSTLIGILIANIVNELITLSSMLPIAIEWFKTEGPKFIDNLSSYLARLDPAIADSIKKSADKFFSGSFSTVMTGINYLINWLMKIPGVFMVYLFSLLTAIYVSIDFQSIKKRVSSFLSRNKGNNVKKVIVEGNRMIGKYILAYLLLISITFVEAYIGTSILNIKYAVILSIITAICDILPILGPGTVLNSLAVIFMIRGDYVRGIGLFVLYIIITVVRQVLEPKVVSSSLGVHPLAIIMALFIGLKAHGFAGMIFTIFYVVFYNVLKRVGYFNIDTEPPENKKTIEEGNLQN